MSQPQNIINHVSMELDASTSIRRLAEAVIKVVDGEIKYMARRSQELNQETRVTIYTFADAHRIECIYYDMDVLRLPSLRDRYSPNGMTALIDATMKSIDDLSKTAQLYGDHSFLNYVITDGEENASRKYNQYDLSRRLSTLPDNWTNAVLVPNARAVHEAKKCGFHKDNIAIWDATSASGVAEGGTMICQATESFMLGRSQGIRGTRSLFSTGIDAVNRDTVRSTLKPLNPSAYSLLDVERDTDAKTFAEDHGFFYSNGIVFYQFTKREDIQHHKKIAIVEKATGKVYVGDEARTLIGLPIGEDKRESPDFNPEYTLFIQSTAPNRKLLRGTRALVMGRALVGAR